MVMVRIPARCRLACGVPKRPALVTHNDDPGLDHAETLRPRIPSSPGASTTGQDAQASLVSPTCRSGAGHSAAQLFRWWPSEALPFGRTGLALVFVSAERPYKRMVGHVPPSGSPTRVRGPAGTVTPDHRGTLPRSLRSTPPPYRANFRVRSRSHSSRKIQSD
jgi:hypothetical protein